jgi:hypothetical protein
MVVTLTRATLPSSGGPLWVMGCRSDYVGSTSGVPEIADELIAPRKSAEVEEMLPLAGLERA